MKKLMIGIAVLAALVLGCRADTYTYSVAITNGLSISNEVQASGWLDKIEVSQDASATCTVVVATYDQNGTAVDTFASLSALVGNKIVRTRAVGTGNTGTDLTYATANGVGNTNVVQVVSVPYDRIMIGGNTKVFITGSGGPAAAKNNVKVAVYFEPLRK